MALRGSENVSFVVPAYNCSRWIVEAVSSVLNGNLQSGDEVIVVDDASTDDSAAVIRDLAIRYPCVRMLSHRYNKGSAAASRNTAICAAAHDLIFCLDADNILVPGTVPLLKTHMSSTGADAAAFGELHYFAEHDRRVTHRWVYRPCITLADALAGAYWPGPSGNYLFTRDSWLRAGRYDESIGGAHDSWAFGIQQLATGTKMVTLAGTFYYHRCAYQSTYVRESSRQNSSLATLRVLLRFLDLLDQADVDYILSRDGRHEWFEGLAERPIRLRSGDEGLDGERHAMSGAHPCVPKAGAMTRVSIVRRVKARLAMHWWAHGCAGCKVGRPR